MAAELLARMPGKLAKGGSARPWRILVGACLREAEVHVCLCLRFASDSLVDRVEALVKLMKTPSINILF
jgi:hypothetical protein